MQITPSKFASWSLVASALILAAGIVAAAVVLRGGRKEVAAVPEPALSEKEKEARTWGEEFRRDSAMRWARGGWKAGRLGQKYFDATNNAAWIAPDLPEEGFFAGQTMRNRQAAMFWAAMGWRAEAGGLDLDSTTNQARHMAWGVTNEKAFFAVPR